MLYLVKMNTRERAMSDLSHSYELDLKEEFTSYLSKEQKTPDLLNGPIFSSLAKLALPITASSMSNMLLNMVNTFWIGSLGSSAVAAVGTAGLIMWFTEAIILLSRVGAQVFTAQALGREAYQEARHFAKVSLQLGLMLGILTSFLVFVSAPLLLSIFNLKNPQTLSFAILYLRIFALSIPLSYLTKVYTALATSLGNSKICLYFVMAGTALNLLLAPLFIKVFAWGIMGAGLASLFAQALMFILFAWKLHDTPLLKQQKQWFTWHGEAYISFIRLGTPAMLETMFLSSIGMYIGRMVSQFGDNGIAVQRLGAQIESISWQTTEGFSLAVSTFIAQNYGAKQWDRIKKGYFTSVFLLTLLSIVTTFVLYAYGGTIFSWFVQDEAMILGGADYLRILSYSQFLMCIEIMTIYAFYGFGKTFIPSAIVILFTLARIPMAHFHLDVLHTDINGIWWTLTHSSNMKGILLFIAFMIFLRRKLKDEATLQNT